MNVYVMVDIEGISGIYTREQVLPSQPRFNEGRKYMTADVNACTRGLKDAGVDKVYVCDCHGGSYSLIWDELSEDADYYICGETQDKRFWGIEDCDAIILLGYHAMAGSPIATLEHSWNSMRVQNMWVNGQKVGELAMDAAVATMYGKKVIMVSGDDKACAEAREVIPNVVCAEVKKASGVFGAMLMPPEAAHKLIYQKAMEAVANADNCGEFSFETPITAKVEVTERGALPNPSAYPYVKLVDGHTFTVEADNPEQLISRVMI